MSESKKRSKGIKQTYQHRTNAICITLYSPFGDTIPAEVRHQAEQAILEIALPNELLINIATT